jgi:hypothetical protein
VLRLCRAIGVFAPTEKYDARTVKTKVVFCAAQLAFTVVCFAPTPLLYYSQRAHLAYLIVVFTTSLYYGASFYIEIFRYTVKVDSSNHSQAIIRCPQDQNWLAGSAFFHSFLLWNNVEFSVAQPLFCLPYLFACHPTRICCIRSQRYHVALVQKAEALRLRREGSAADLHAALAVAGAAASEAGGGSSAKKSMPLSSPSLSSAKSHDSDASLSSLGSNSGASEDD